MTIWRDSGSPSPLPFSRVVKNVRMDAYYNMTTSTETSYGITSAFGYEFMSTGGFFFRALAGFTYVTSKNWSNADQAPTQPALQLALGAKLW